jgi:hypothetical protein
VFSRADDKCTHRFISCDAFYRNFCSSTKRLMRSVQHSIMKHISLFSVLRPSRVTYGQIVIERSAMQRRVLPKAFEKSLPSLVFHLLSAQITLLLLLSPHLLHFHSFNNPSNHGIGLSSSKSIGGGSQSAKKPSRRSHDTNPNAPASIGAPTSSRWVSCWSL